MGVYFSKMDILKKNTSPTFQIVPRKTLDSSMILEFQLKNEMSQVKETIAASIILLENENYQIKMDSFPIGKIGDKIAYTLIDTFDNEVISLGKILIASENENIQDYSKKTNNKFYN
jgi:hypothetical protein